MRILIVEDEKEIAGYLQSGFEQEGFAVDLAYDGKNGLFMATTNDYDVMVLDIVLPYLSGTEVCRAIRVEGKIFPIIILSVKSEISMKVDLFNIGADDYITKPFSFDELTARVKAVLKRGNNNLKDGLMKAGDLEMDIKKRSVKRGGKPIQLTRKEFSFLEYLLIHLDEVVSRNILLEHIWDINANPFSNTMETHVKNLRKKIDGEYEKKLIHTIPGVGYKLSAER